MIDCTRKRRVGNSANEEHSKIPTEMKAGSRKIPKEEKVEEEEKERRRGRGSPRQRPQPT